MDATTARRMVVDISKCGSGRLPMIGRPSQGPILDRRSQVGLIQKEESTLDPINPYAVIALVAALLGLFPVAIVFGILAFGRATGRGIATAALVIGVIEALVIGGVVYSASASLHFSETGSSKSSLAPDIGDKCNYSSDSHTAAADGTDLVCRYDSDGPYWIEAP
ncbi:MAG: DUF4190 domain-containing protein [Rhodococcus sp. (in: high G+C Gram-positive bacteria)]|nr:MAG: DUF4190 domain-containing protein [Rhodococcus sp. (in: high G+C Gram-positive bacteria)]